jgi:O-antigen ligase
MGFNWILLFEAYKYTTVSVATLSYYFAPVIVMLAIVLLTGSRGALLAFLVVAFVHVCIMLASTRHKGRNILLTALLMVLLLGAFDLVLAQMPDAVAKRFSWDYITEKGTTGRTNIWKFLLGHYAGDSIPTMLFGHGYGTTIIVNTMNSRVAHNLYLDNLITLGLAGMVLQLVIQGSVLRILVRCRQHTLLGAYFGMICMCLSLSLVAYKPIWNIMLLALAIDANRISVKNLSNDEKQEVQP